MTSETRDESKGKSRSSGHDSLLAASEDVLHHPLGQERAGGRRQETGGRREETPEENRVKGEHKDTCFTVVVVQWSE